MKKYLCIILVLLLVFSGCTAEPSFLSDPTDADSIVSDLVKNPNMALLEDNPTKTESTEPATDPTEAPTTEPTEEPTTEPTSEPTEEPTTEPTEEPTTEPIEEPTEEPTDPPATEPTEPPVVFVEVYETVYAKAAVNIRPTPSTEEEPISYLNWSESIIRIGIGDNGWSKVLYNGTEAYISSNYLQRTKPQPAPTEPPATEPPATEPPATEPPVTEPPATEPVVPPATEPPATEPTEPPATEPPVTEPPVTEPPATEPTKPESGITEVNETVYAISDVNIRSGPGKNYEIIGALYLNNKITRIGICDNGWSKVLFEGREAYIHSDYLTTEEPPKIQTSGYPKTYSDGTCTITIYREWYTEREDGKGAWCYAAHVQFTDYTRFGTSCAKGSYNNGYESTPGAHRRLGAILTVNGCYSAPSLNYTVVRKGVIWNGADKERFWCPAVYSSYNGLFLSAWDSDGTPGISGENINDLVAAGKVTDTFCFGPPILSHGSNWGGSDTSRAQRTFIGTNGNPGDLWIIVSDGRYNDGESAGLTYREMANYMISKGCIFGVPLDGGGSSTMVFMGKTLNAAKGNERYVVDFVYFK